MHKTTTQIEITTDYLELQQLLKIVGLISTGGEAKFFLATNVVSVNGENEKRRGRKLFPKDLVKVKDVEYAIVKKCI